MPFTWTINPYRGCEFACKYCYARYTHEFMEMHDGLDFERKIYVKQQTAWLLRQDLRKVKAGEEIAIGTATDPYQPAERRFEITRSILQEMAQHRGLQIGIVTKSDLVVRDIDVLLEVAKHNVLFVNLTVTTMNTKLARILEPRAPRPDLRMQALTKLTQAGVAAGVICAPVLPGITDSPAALDKLVRATKEAGGRYIYANPLFLKPCSASVFLPFLEKEFPHLATDYRKRYADHAFVGKAVSAAAVGVDGGTAEEAWNQEGSDGSRSDLEGVSRGGGAVGAVWVVAPPRLAPRRRARTWGARS